MGELNFLQTLSFFIVGQDEGHQINQLGSLNQLSGKLDIENLENVRDQEEARSANLAKLDKINQLGFYWSDGSDRKVNHHIEEEVLEALYPHQDLKSLTIDGFGGKKFPSWMLTSRNAMDALSPFYNLIKINLNHCNKCKQVPTLRHLPCLEALKIEGMDNVTCIGVEFYGMHSNALFPALGRLIFRNLHNLRKWKDALEVTPASVVFPCLELLIIEKCPQLTSAPYNFPHLQRLKVSEISYTALESISSNLTTLTSARIYEVPELAFVPQQLFYIQSLEIKLSYILDAFIFLKWGTELEIYGCFPGIQAIAPHLRCLRISGCDVKILPSELQLCTSLSVLEIRDCPNLKSLPDLQGFHSLEILEISGCPKLKSISDLGELYSLTVLKIFHCSKLTRLPEASLQCLNTMVIGGYCEALDAFPSLNCIQHFHMTLKFLQLKGWAKLNSLPNEIQYLTSLTSLGIYEFHGIEAVPEWLGYLSSLQELYLHDCNNLMYLPTAQTMQWLTRLQTIEIRNCYKLQERCASGAEWFKISHIPNVVFW